MDDSINLDAIPLEPFPSVLPNILPPVLPVPSVNPLPPAVPLPSLINN